MTSIATHYTYKILKLMLTRWGVLCSPLKGFVRSRK